MEEQQKKLQELEVEMEEGQLAEQSQPHLPPPRPPRPAARRAPTPVAGQEPAAVEGEVDAALVRAIRTLHSQFPNASDYWILQGANRMVVSKSKSRSEIRNGVRHASCTAESSTRSVPPPPLRNSQLPDTKLVP